MGRVEIHDDVLASLKAMLADKKDPRDPEQLINDVLMVFAHDGFIRRSDIASMHVVNRVFKRQHTQSQNVFDNITKELKGLRLIGKEVEQSIWINDPKLCDAIESNQVVLVMKTPRTKGISIEESNEIHIVQTVENSDA